VRTTAAARAAGANVPIEATQTTNAMALPIIREMAWRM
jgi:hypothetical protein